MSDALFFERVGVVGDDERLRWKPRLWAEGQLFVAERHRDVDVCEGETGYCD